MPPDFLDLPLRQMMLPFIGRLPVSSQILAITCLILKSGESNRRILDGKNYLSVSMQIQLLLGTTSDFAPRGEEGAIARPAPQAHASHGEPLRVNHRRLLCRASLAPSLPTGGITRRSTTTSFAPPPN